MRQDQGEDLWTAPSSLYGALLFAAGEIGLGLLVGRFFDWGRAEAFLFFAFRPWLLLIAAAAVAGWHLGRRYLFYALALLAAGLGETMLVIAMGATSPWAEMLRGWGAGALLVLVFDLVIGASRRLVGSAGVLGGTLLLAAALLIPNSLAPYERLALGWPGGTAAERPAVTVLTSLPLAWGESGAFAPNSRPAESWRLLEQEFTLRAIEHVDEASLSGAKVMLLAQPRQLAPEELVTLDQWVSRGGRILVLTDPDLAWPTRLPLGDVRRPIATNMLTPLLSHWGVAIGSSTRGSSVVRIGRRQVLLSGTAPLAGRRPGCVQEADFLLDCAIGQGRATIVADADLLHDSTFIAPGLSAERPYRSSDNVQFIADRLDRLVGLDRRRATGDVQWADADFSRGKALLWASAPIALLLLIAILAWSRQSRYSPTYPQPAEEMD